jgi:lysophospholipase L1-like esterase
MLPFSACLALTIAPSLGAGTSSPGLASQTGRVRIVTSPVTGLGRETGVGRRDASDVIQVGDLNLVLYTRLDAEAPLYPAPYTGKIWYATSSDQGNSWIERGLLLDHGPSGSFDAVGVYEPSILNAADGSLWLYYSGVGPEFNFRFELQRRVEPVQIGVARLFVDVQTGEARAERLESGRPVLEPRERSGRSFDSLRVGGASPLLRNGLVNLYYRARQYGRDGAGSVLGLARSSGGTGSFERAHQGRDVLPFSGDPLLLPWRHGILALVTDRSRGFYFASDGEHFARLPVQVLGRLNAPGVLRGITDSDEVIWGLHGGGAERPDPYLERFQFQLSSQLPEPPRALQAIPSSHQAAHWHPGSTWLAQHRECLESAATRPRDYLFLGDGLTEGFGGHDRSRTTPGAEVWAREFEGKQALNLGVAGDRTEHLMWRLDHGALDNARCRAVILLVGGENLEEDSPADVTLAIESLLHRIQYELPFTEVVLQSIPARPAVSGELWERIAACNEQLARLGRWPRVNFFDLARELSDAEGRPRPEYFDSASPLLSAAGYEKWVGALVPLLDSIEEPVPESAAQKLDELNQDG